MIKSSEGKKIVLSWLNGGVENLRTHNFLDMNEAAINNDNALENLPGKALLLRRKGRKIQIWISMLF